VFASHGRLSGVAAEARVKSSKRGKRGKRTIRKQARDQPAMFP
jgi:hypothetical protein